jgi:hypothetical protein
MMAAEQMQWDIVSIPAIADAYTYAVQTHMIERPGQDPAVVTDEAILSAVSTVLGVEE